jgi:hypothetical protein
MTADEIRQFVSTCDDGSWESAHWLQEIAAQLAELNAQLRSVIYSKEDLTTVSNPLMIRVNR